MRHSADVLGPTRMLGAIERPRMTAWIALRAAAMFAALAICIAAVAVTIPWLERRPAAKGDAEPVYLPRAEYLRLMSLGYDNVLADVLWFRTINYFGKRYRGARTYPWLAHMCDLVTDLDPRAEHVYRFAGTILPWEAGQADAGIRLLEKGLKVFPDSWLLQYWLGFNYYFFKSDLERAATHIGNAAKQPGAHPIVARLAGLLAAESYGPQTTLRFLYELREEVDTQEMREVVERQIREAELTRDIEQLEAVARTYRERNGSLPATLEALVDAGMLAALPVEPFGGRYQIDAATGQVTSTSGHKRSKLHQSQLRAKHLRGGSVRDF